MNRRLRIYGFLLWTFLVLHITVVCVAAFLLVQHLVQRDSTLKNLKAISINLKRLEKLNTTAQQLWAHTSAKTGIDGKIVFHLSQIFNEQLKTQSMELQKNLEVLDGQNYSYPLLLKNLNTMSTYRSEKLKKVNRIGTILYQGQRQLLYAVAIPMLILVGITFAAVLWLRRKYNLLKSDLQQRIVRAMQALRDVSREYPDQAFKNPDFWLQIVLIIMDHVGEWMDHPLADMVSEVSHLVREELKKQTPRAS